MLPDLPGLGVWQLDTSSVNSITNVNTVLEVLAQLALKMGRESVAWLPLLLTISPITVQIPGKDGKLFKKEVYILNLSIKDTLIDFMKMEASKSSSLPEIGSDMMPEPTVEEDLYPEVNLSPKHLLPDETEKDSSKVDSFVGIMREEFKRVGKDKFKEVFDNMEYDYDNPTSVKNDKIKSEIIDILKKIPTKGV